MTPIIEVNQLCKSFDRFNAVNNLSFTVNKGDIFGFLGENGAGKSTTIRMLLTLIQPTSGSIQLFEEPLQQNRKSILQRVGAVIEKPDLYKYLSAYENLNLFAKMSGLKLSKNTLMQQLDVVGLADRSHSKVKTFSQGMKQRLGIAVALVHDPQLIMLDEPTNGLDPQGIVDIRNLIMRLSQERGKTILVSSHLLSEIELIANILHKGEKVVEGSVKSLLDPAETIIKIETSDNKLAFELLKKWEHLENVVLNENEIHIKMHKNETPFLIRFLTENKMDIFSVKHVNSLEDYFLNLTKSDTHVQPFTN
jgi:ABC-type multidrug transport system ATPase subunit